MNLNAIYYSFPKWRSGSFNSVSLFNPVQTTISLYQPAYCPFITRQPMQSVLCNRGVIEGLGQCAYATPPGAAREKAGPWNSPWLAFKTHKNQKKNIKNPANQKKQQNNKILNTMEQYTF